MPLKLRLNLDIEASKKRLFQGSLITFAIGSLAIGLLVVLHATKPGPDASWTWVPAPALTMFSTTVVENPAGGLSVGQIIVDLVYSFGVLIYYLLVAVTSIGLALIGLAILGGVSQVTQDDVNKLLRFGTYLVTQSRIAAHDRRVQAGVLLGGSFVGLIHTGSGPVLFEFLSVVLIIGFGWAILSGMTLFIYWRFRRVDTDLFVVIPLAFLSIFFPILVAGLLSPTLQSSTVEISTTALDWMIGDLRSLWNKQSTIDNVHIGIGWTILLAWGFILVLIGWVVGSVLYGLRTIEKRFLS